MTAEERTQFITAVGRHPGAAGRGTPDLIDALVTVAGGVLMLGWLTLIT